MIFLRVPQPLWSQTRSKLTVSLVVPTDGPAPRASGLSPDS